MNFSQLDNMVFDGVQDEATSKNQVDIVFVVDDSSSMNAVKDGIKNHIVEFANTLESGTGVDIDYRLGFVLHGHEKILIRQFTDDADAFKSALVNGTTRHDTGWNEFGLPALDVAADFPWQKKRHKFVLFFTDEGVGSGDKPNIQIAKYDELLSKLEQLKVKLYFYGPDTQEYRHFQRVPGTEYNPTEDFNGMNFSKILNTIAKSVSVSSSSPLDGSQDVGVQKDLYDINSHVQVINVRR
ncbi:MAG: vWA domain-containing protein [Campylobacterota bacterium]|nr:vWA domain-containing protein [Campylobacterota bacterium]